VNEEIRERLAAVEGLVEPVEGEKLAELAAQVPRDRTIVEIGSHTGLSTLYLAEGSRSGEGAHVVAVDPFPEPRPKTPGIDDDPFGLGADGVLGRFLENLEGYRDIVTPLRSTSLEVARTWLAPIGLVFVDALHEYEDVRADVEAWGPYVSPGGWLALHDIWEDPERTRPSPTAAVVEQVIRPAGRLADEEIVWNLWVGRFLG